MSRKNAQRTYIEHEGGSVFSTDTGPELKKRSKALQQVVVSRTHQLESAQNKLNMRVTKSKQNEQNNSASIHCISKSVSMCPQLLKALTPEENVHCQHGLYFQDGQRRVDYVLTYAVKKPGGSRSSRQSVHLLAENAVARSLRRGPHSRGKQQRHHQTRDTRDSLHLAASPEADVEMGCVGETSNGQEDHKAFRREEFEGKLRDMGLELEKDDVRFLLSFVVFACFIQ